MNLPDFQFTEDQVAAMFKEAQRLVDYYEKNYRTIGIDDLLNLEDKIAVYSAHFGEIAAKFNRDNANAYLNRLVTRADKVQKHMIGFKMSISASKELVETELKDARWAEMEASYFAERIDNLLRAFSKILDTIGRRLTHLGREKRDADFRTGTIKKQP